MKTKSVKKSDIRFAILAIDAACFRIIQGKLCVLLGKVHVEPYFKNQWGLIGGIIRPQENAEKAAERNLREKAGISKIYMEQLYTFSRVDRDPRGRVVSLAYLALAASNPQTLKSPKVETRWIPVGQATKLAYDHDEILAAALRRLRAKIGYTNIAQHLLPKSFTLTELQDAYEIVLKKELDKRNFRKKVVSTGLIKLTGQVRRGEPMRPAKLYKFAAPEIRIIEIL